MNCSLQYWTTSAIALLAVIIAVGQWRTAQQRAVFELFDRRMKMYAMDGAEFLLRDNIVNQLTAISRAIDRIARNSGNIQADLNTVKSFYTDFQNLLRPYMRMHQKSPWWSW